MVKLFIFESVEDARQYERGRMILPAEDAPRREPAAGGGIDTEPESPKRHYKKRGIDPEREAVKARLLAKARTGKSKGRTCSKCGNVGHNAKTCTEGKPAASVEDQPEELGEGIKEKVADLREEGKNSGEIAKELGVSLKTVNQYW